MNTKIKKILPYFITSLIIIGLGKMASWTDNYRWDTNPPTNELLLLKNALRTIFIYKTLFWLIIANVSVFAIIKFIKKSYIISVLSAVLIVIFYFSVRQFIYKKCAFPYYVVFLNQYVSEEYIDEPIVSAGCHIGPIVTENIANKDMKYRRYAISGLVEIKYFPATPVLKRILLDTTESYIIRSDAYEALSSFDTDESKKILNDFRKLATDSINKKVIENGESYLKQR